MPNVILGNILSGFSAGFLILSAVLKRKKAIYFSQCMESLFLFFAQLAFFQIGAAICLFISIIKNILLYFGKYSRAPMVLVALASFVFGVIYNTGGVIGLIPVAASVLFSITCYFAKSVIGIKLVTASNLALWSIYSFFIFDLVSFIVNGFSLAVNLFYVIKNYKVVSDQKG